MTRLRYWIHAIIWAIWEDTGRPKWLLKPLKWINNERVKRYEL